jgi:hypothetical protein
LTFDRNVFESGPCSSVEVRFDDAHDCAATGAKDVGNASAPETTCQPNGTAGCLLGAGDELTGGTVASQLPMPATESFSLNSHRVHG